MTTYFRHTTTNHIQISDGTHELITTLEVFIQLEPAYLIKNGARKPYLTYKYKEYIPSVKHTLLTTTGNQELGDVPWSEGNTYISNVEDYIDVINNPTQDLPTEKNIKIAALMGYANTRMANSGISLFSTTMPVIAAPVADLEAYARATATPTGYYLYKSDGTKKTLTLAQLQEYADALAEINWEYRKKTDEHKDAINACVDIAAVQAYNFETGYPATPFVPS